MPKRRSAFQRAAGKLTSAIQKEWGEELGTDSAAETEEVMNRSHVLLRMESSKEAREFLNGEPVADYLGANWVERHPKVMPYIAALEGT